LTLCWHLLRHVTQLLAQRALTLVLRMAVLRTRFNIDVWACGSAINNKRSDSATLHKI